MPEIKAVLFDLDGTLADSFQDITISANYILESLGKPAKTLDDVRKNVGHGIRNMIMWTLEVEDGERIDELVQAFRDYYWDHCLDNTVLYPGAMECLEKLDGYAKAVVTNKHRIFAEKMVEGLGIRDFFDEVLGGDDYPAMKPDPRAVLEACKWLKVDPSNALMVGDSRPDIASASGAGVVACGITYGIGTLEEIKDAGADKILDSLADLPAYIEKINGR